ncbi:hypothetical protein LCI18_006465 [Fusarium solani-melongenae]|uniref:Uncharacterized protein n=1 Tax=Fusarium solani subsp. cucurbitae TaxID=2747967 RepID=A0ACD3Z336_FUSSC|nr:hypothetical protein LCI18_006465 [Fusarium solani-melongenae]
MADEMDNGVVKRFKKWVKENQRTGMSCSDQPCPYVPPSLLTTYWNRERIKEVLDSFNFHDDVDSIIGGFLRIFSTLVYIRQPRLIAHFLRDNRSDHQLPFSSSGILDDWPPEFGDFLEHQWMFFPVEFSNNLMYKRELHPRQILPVTYGESLRGETYAGDGSSIRKVELHPECNTMTETNTNPVVFKIFSGSDMKRQYEAEAAVYLRLRRQPKAQKHIAEHYGSFSFEESQKRVIILEYTPLGSLVDFFKQTQPSSPTEYKMLWDELLKLVGALYALHNLDRRGIEGDKNGFTAAVHQDIQPANILVFTHPEKNPPRAASRFDVRFKLADFGLAEARRVSSSDDHFIIQNQGNLMYSAPECFANHPLQTAVRPKVTTKIDIWALGAVFSDVLVWSITGEAGREEYRQVRMAALKEQGQFKSDGREAFFHDNQYVLQAVVEYHGRVLGHKRVDDFISEKMSRFILHEMLTDEDCRLPAEKLMPRVDKLSREMKLEMQFEAPLDSPQSPLSPASGSGQMSRVQEDTAIYTERPHRRSRTPQEPPPATSHSVTAQPTIHKPAPGQASVDKIYEKLVSKSKATILKRRTWDRIQGKHSEISIDLPEMKHAWALIKTHGGRDQIILIDNYVSMESHLDILAKTARVISYVTKVADTNGMDLFFTSDSAKSYKHTSSKTVESAIRKMGFVKGKCNMKTCLDNILKAISKDGHTAIRPTSIYVYTDAVWEDADEVASVIKRAIRRLAKAEDDPSTLMFQFIQFGNDETGGKCLQKLDDECKEIHCDVEYDIVDTKRWYAEVPSIVIGSLSRENDLDNSAAPRHSQADNVT